MISTRFFIMEEDRGTGNGTEVDYNIISNSHQEKTDPQHGNLEYKSHGTS
jgi:hypothetical protein